MKLSLALALALLVPTAPLQAQKSSSSETPALEERVAALDNALSTAFNAHDLSGLMSLFAEDIEFYHDADGLQTRAEVARGFQQLFAQNNGIRRDLVPGTLEIYPIKNYGALEVGSHRVCHEETGKTECGTFHFAHLWRQQGDQWKISRVLSYGH
jgi:ketosteroid isomerase-like protein